MAYIDLVTTNISLETNAVSQAGFGTPIFIGAHNWFPERVRSYGSVTEAATDLSTVSEEYIAIQGFFSASPQPSTVKIGRMDSVTTLTPQNVATGASYSVTVAVNDDDSVVATYVAGAGDTAADVVDALKLAIDGDAGVAAHTTTAKVGALAAAVLTIKPTVYGTDELDLSSLSNLAPTGTSTETPSEVMAAISVVDDDFYFVTAHDHTESFVVAMATDVESREKLYFFSNQDDAGIDAKVDPATSILGILSNSGNTRTVALFHQDADTAFPETNLVGFGAPSTPGHINWNNNIISGLSASADPTGGARLSNTQKSNLNDKDANYIDYIAGTAVFRSGRTVAGIRIGEMRSRDFLVARITTAYQDKLINSAKIPYTDSGINEMRSVLKSVLDRSVTTPAQPNILQDVNPYTTSFPRRSDVSFTDLQSGTLNGSFVAYLAGSIDIIKIEGTLTFELAA